MLRRGYAAAGKLTTATWCLLRAHIHINNPLTGGDSWDNSSNRVVGNSDSAVQRTRPLRSGSTKLADITHNLRRHDGKVIPVNFPPVPYPGDI